MRAARPALAISVITGIIGLITAACASPTSPADSSRAGSTPTTASAAVTGSSATGSDAAHTTYPLTLDNCGTSVTFDKAPQRVVAIKSTSIEMMLALGLGNRIVGTAFPDGPYSTTWAPTTPLPLISDKVPGQEATLALQPDLVYAGWESNVTADGAGDRATLAGLGVNTLVSPAACQESAYQPNPLTWDDIFAEIELVGEIFDVQGAASALVAKMQGRLSAVTPDTRGLTALWYSSGTKAGVPYVGAGIGNPELVMKAVGLTNIAAEVPMTWSSLSWEAVIAADPDVIVVVDSAWGPAQMKIDKFESDPAISSLTAVKNHRYLIVPFPAGEAGVRSVEAVETLSAQLAELDLP